MKMQNLKTILVTIFAISLDLVKYNILKEGSEGKILLNLNNNKILMIC